MTNIFAELRRLTTGSKPDTLAESSHWTITLHDGEQISLAAYAYSEEGPELVFSIGTEGNAPYYADIFFRIPAHLVTSVRSETPVLVGSSNNEH